MCIVSSYTMKAMCVQSNKDLLGAPYIMCIQLQFVCMYVCVCLRLGCGGPHGRGREFLGTRPLTVKHFRGCPSQT